MVKAFFDGDEVRLTAEPSDIPTIKRLRSAYRTNRMPPLTWVMPLTFDSVEELRREKIPCNSELAKRAQAMLAAHRFVDAQKAADKVEPIRPIPIKEGFTLFNHQVKAFNIALALFGYPAGADGGACAMYMDMGTGKSLTSVMIAGRLFLDGKIRRMLVVAPSSVCPVWPSEFRKFGAFPSRVAVLQGDKNKRLAALRYVEAPAMPGQRDPLRVAVINYESTWRLEDELKTYAADLIVCDESQRIKSHTAQQSKAMHRLGAGARYRMILTGTPIQNDTRDLWSQYRFLAPDVFPASYYAFEKRYALMGGYGQHQYLGPRNLEELTRKAHGIAYRVTKAECLDLPEKTFETREIALEDSAANLYQRIKKNAVAELEGGESVTASIVLTRLLRLQQITGGFVTDDDGTTTKVSSAKLDAVADIVQSLCVDEGKKLVIFTRFRAEMDGVSEAVQKVLGGKLQMVRIAGDIDIAKRGSIVEQFQTDPDTRVFVGQIDACAEGITLTAADTVVYYSLTFNMAKYAVTFMLPARHLPRVGVRIGISVVIFQPYECSCAVRKLRKCQYPVPVIAHLRPPTAFSPNQRLSASAASSEILCRTRPPRRSWGILRRTRKGRLLLWVSHQNRRPNPAKQAAGLQWRLFCVLPSSKPPLHRLLPASEHNWAFLSGA